MIPYIIGVILLIITLLIVGLILRKRIYDTVDRQEMWKMDIMNRNTAAELARIKGLNLSGETQEKFESWKERWEFIVASELPDVSEMLFEAEDAADRYRFPSARNIIQKVHEKLNTIEKDIERMLAELNELLESEKISREEIEELQPKLEELQQSIIENKDAYGKSDIRFAEAVSEIKEGPKIYDELVEAGNYIEAKEFVDQLQRKFFALEEEVNEFPELLQMCVEHLPSQLDELTSGIKTMEVEGYRINHLDLEQHIHNYHQRLLDCVEALEQGSVPEVKVIIAEMEEQISEIYELLEKEAIAKKYVETHIESYKQAVKELEGIFDETKAEVEISRKAYYFEDENMEKYLSLEKSITRASQNLDKLVIGVDDEEKAHSELRARLEKGDQELEELTNEHQIFKDKVQRLRKDERAANEQLMARRKEVSDLNRKVRQRNLPGIPDFIWSILETATKGNDQVMKALAKEPLDIGEVNHALEVATAAVDDATKQVDMMLDQAYLTEQVIQYANRYRSKYPLLAAKLSEAERLFRSYEYELSLEHAAQAIEEIEPGALKQIEANQVAMLS